MNYATSSDLTDPEFLELALAARLEQFGHREHLRVAFAAVKATNGSIPEATALCKTIIRRIAAHAGEPDKYHETITVAWATLMAHHVSQSPDLSWPDLLATEPQLSQKSELLRHYTRQRLFSSQARAMWVPPDLKPLPAPPR